MEDPGCLACGTALAADARFCPGCGTPLTIACPACGRAAERSHRFCAGCGRLLDGDAPAASPAAPEGERKQVTVLFADVAGSMDLAEGTDPEDWARSMDEFFRVLSDGVIRFGGTVDKFTGDGIMALFGAPLSQEDHARRACHAALHLQEVTAALAFDVRIGINSGEVVVGGIGAEGRLEYTALGHTVGLAQRMESMAEPGTVLVTGHTNRLVRNDFALSGLGLRAVKGSSEPLPVFRLDGARPRSGTGGSSVMVGRAEEMAVLEAALARAQEGQAQVVGVVGEAGVGKSRLCDEFCRAVTDRGMTVRRVAGVSHARDVPFLPVLEMLRGYFAVLDTDTRAEARAKVAGRLLDLDPAFDEALPLMFDFMEIPDPERPAPRLAPSVRLEQIFATIRQITKRRSSRQVIVFLWEDLHWFDPQSVAFFERLILSFPGTRTLVLTNFRPEFDAPWARHSYYRQLPLSPLDPDAVGRLLVALLGGDVALSAFAHLIAETTAGSPFFVEEVVRSLVEDGTLTGSPGAYTLSRPVVALGVPPTVQATLAARIDRLGERDKAVLQTAAVIGRVFTEPVVRLASGLPLAEVAASLGRLCRAEFLQEMADGPLEEYRFWHPLTQEVAYGSLLRDRRTGLHRAVAGAIIATDHDRLDERAALLATHFEKAGDALEAARWNDRAADFAVRGDIGESIRRWRMTLDHLRSTSATDESLRIKVKALSRLIRYGARLGMDSEETAALYAEATVASEQLGDPATLAAITFAYASTRFWSGMVSEALAIYRKAFEFAQDAEDPAVRNAYGCAVVMIAAWVGPVTPSLHLAERMEAASGGDPGFGAGILGYSPLTPAGLGQAEILALQGRAEEARAVLARVIAGSRERSEGEFHAWTLSTAPRIARTEPELTSALTAAREAAASTEAAGNTAGLVIALGGVGHAEVRLGRYADGAEHLERALAEGRRFRTGLFDEAKMLTDLARARLGLGQDEAACQLATEAVKVARHQGAAVVECAALLARARILRATGAAVADVVADLDAAQALARDTGASAYEAEAEAERAGVSALPQ
ncbi:MAG: AAA family ATPase [Actinobacteria bacterium]|nr:AAA family ATPase [Actinomycetota bacterium]